MLKQKAKLRTFRTLTITLLMVLSVLLTTIFSIYSPKIFALNETGLAGAYKAGNGAELYNTTDGTFNANVLNDIKEKLFGGQNPKTYIQANGEAEHDITGGYVVKAAKPNADYAYKTINESVSENADETDPNKEAYKDTGMIIKLGGIDWMVVSMTLADIGDKTDNVILTLYQADDYKNGTKVETSKFYSTADKKLGENMYASSILRRTITEGSNYTDNVAGEITDRFSKYDLFRDKGADSFAQNYLVQPKYITYQGKETQRGRANPIGGTGIDGKGYHLPNDSYNAFTTASEWHANTNDYAKQDGIDFGGAYGDTNKQNYGAWQNDYIWAPSATEVGFNYSSTYSYLYESSIWQLTEAQRAHTHNVLWLRSGVYNNYSNAYVVAAAGAYNNFPVYSAFGVRPALHFNLSAARVSAADPTDVEVTYNGSDQTLKSIAGEKTLDWYSAGIYEHTPAYIDLKYYKETAPSTINTSAPVAAPNAAGTYWVKAQITQQWLEDEKNNLIASGVAEADITADMLPKFKGDPGTNPPGVADSEKESDKLRWFKITINQKELTLTLALKDNLNQTLNGGGGVRLLCR